MVFEVLTFLCSRYFKKIFWKFLLSFGTKFNSLIETTLKEDGGQPKQKVVVLVPLAHSTFLYHKKKYINQVPWTQNWQLKRLKNRWKEWNNIFSIFCNFNCNINNWTQGCKWRSWRSFFYYFLKQSGHRVIQNDKFVRTNANSTYSTKPNI